jgi:hypothetical protein
MKSMKPWKAMLTYYLQIINSIVIYILISKLLYIKYPTEISSKPYKEPPSNTKRTSCESWTAWKSNTRYIPATTQKRSAGWRRLRPSAKTRPRFQNVDNGGNYLNRNEAIDLNNKRITSKSNKVIFLKLLDIIGNIIGVILIAFGIIGALAIYTNDNIQSRYWEYCFFL